MNRRTFITAAIGGIAALAVPTLAAAKMTGDWVSVYQEYGEEKYLKEVGHYLLWFDDEKVAKHVMTLVPDEVLEATDDFFLREYVEGAPTLGDESFVVIGKSDADTFLLQVTLRTDNLYQRFTSDGEDKDKLIEDGIARIEAVLGRQVYKDDYTDKELFELLLTEEEAGFPVIEQKYENGEYEF